MDYKVCGSFLTFCFLSAEIAKKEGGRESSSEVRMSDRKLELWSESEPDSDGCRATSGETKASTRARGEGTRATVAKSGLLLSLDPVALSPSLYLSLPLSRSHISG